MTWNAIRTVMLGYPHARATGDGEVRVAFEHVDVEVVVRVVQRQPVLLIAELGPLGAFDALVALRFNMLAVQRIGVLDDRYVLRDEVTSADPDAITRQLMAFVRTAAGLRRRSRRRDMTAFAFAV